MAGTCGVSRVGTIIGVSYLVAGSSFYQKGGPRGKNYTWKIKGKGIEVTLSKESYDTFILLYVISVY